MRATRAGFTLIELMVVVSILGVLAALAVPSFSMYVKRSRSSEAPQQLKTLFTRTAFYYSRESADQGVAGLHRVNCVVGPVHNNVTPKSVKIAGDYSAPEWLALGHSFAYGFYRYEVVTPGGARCHVPANTPDIHELRAIGDLDDDEVMSTFDLSVGSNGENELYHARSVYVVNGYE